MAKKASSSSSVIKRKDGDPDGATAAMFASLPSPTSVRGSVAPKHSSSDHDSPHRRPFFDSWTAVTSAHDEYRNGLRRAIALVLEHVGFDSATPTAFEAFASLAETYLASLLSAALTNARAARRNVPTPTDFEAALRRFRISISSLRPHARRSGPPIRDASTRLVPRMVDARRDGEEDEQAAFARVVDLRPLGEELSGQRDKEERAFVPAAFPDFPSRHAWRYTPVEIGAQMAVPAVDGVPAADVSGEAAQAATATITTTEGERKKTVDVGGGRAANGTTTTMLVPANPLLRSPKTKRETAAREAKQGEEALRRLVRAAKIRSQMEVRQQLMADETRAVVVNGSGGSAKAQKQLLSAAAKEDENAAFEAMLGLNRRAARTSGTGTTAKITAKKRPPEPGAGRDRERQRARERFEAWESAMRDLLANQPQTGREAPSAGGKFEIADHSMVVNAERPFRRTELARPGSSLQLSGQ